MMKSGITRIILVSFVILALSVSFVSAGFLGDFFDRFTGGGFGVITGKLLFPWWGSGVKEITGKPTADPPCTENEDCYGRFTEANPMITPELIDQYGEEHLFKCRENDEYDYGSEIDCVCNKDQKCEPRSPNAPDLKYCLSDADCQGIAEKCINYYCKEPDCTRNADCMGQVIRVGAYGEGTLSTTGELCSATLQCTCAKDAFCRLTSKQCIYHSQCGYAENCIRTGETGHCEEVECNRNIPCAEEGKICSTDGNCIEPPQGPPPCLKDTDCAFNEFCHIMSGNCLNFFQYFHTDKPYEAKSLYVKIINKAANLKKKLGFVDLPQGMQGTGNVVTLKYGTNLNIPSSSLGYTADSNLGPNVDIGDTQDQTAGLNLQLTPDKVQAFGDATQQGDATPLAPEVPYLAEEFAPIYTPFFIDWYKAVGLPTIDAKIEALEIELCQKALGAEIDYGDIVVFEGENPCSDLTKFKSPQGPVYESTSQPSTPYTPPTVAETAISAESMTLGAKIWGLFQ